MAHIGNAPFGKTIRNITSETLTSVKTAFYPTGGYTADYLDVFVNGVRQTNGIDFTATNGVLVTLQYNPTIGDTVDIISYSLVEMVNAVKRDGDTLVGTLNTQALVPTANITYDIGTSTMRYRDIYLSGNTINLGDIKLSTNGTAFSVANTTGGTFPSALANTTITGTLTANATTITGNVSITGTQFVNGAVTFANSSSNTFTVTDAGHAGLSSTPSSYWNAGSSSYGFKALNIGRDASIFGWVTDTRVNAGMMCNLYLDGSSSFKYIGSGYGSYYRQFQGTHEWGVAANSTANSTASPTLAMIINNSGDVVIANSTTNTSVMVANGNHGIGTTTPGSRLSISGPTTGSLPIVDIVATGNNTFMRGVRMLNSGMGANSQLMYATGQSDSARNMGQMYFTYNSSGNTTNRVSMGLHSVDDLFNLTGNATVGIGTVTPEAKLHVAGTSYFTGEMYFPTSGFAIRRGVGGEWVLGSDTTNLSLGTQAGSGPTLTLAGAGQGRIHINTLREVCLGTTQTNAISSDFVNSMGDVSRDVLASYSGRWARLAIQERSGNWISFLNGSASHYGTISLSGSGVSYGSNSDYRLKENILSLTNGISKLKALKPKQFNFIGQNETVDGFLAHEVQEVAPYAVTGVKDGHETIGNVVNSDNEIIENNVTEPSILEPGHTFVEISTTEKYQQLDPAKLVPILTQALKEVIDKIEVLEQKVSVLEGN